MIGKVNQKDFLLLSVLYLHNYSIFTLRKKCIKFEYCWFNLVKKNIWKLRIQNLNQKIPMFSVGLERPCVLRLLAKSWHCSVFVKTAKF